MSRDGCFRGGCVAEAVHAGTGYATTPPWSRFRHSVRAVFARVHSEFQFCRLTTESNATQVIAKKEQSVSASTLQRPSQPSRFSAILTAKRGTEEEESFPHPSPCFLFQVAESWSRCTSKTGIETTTRFLQGRDILAVWPRELRPKRPALFVICTQYLCDLSGPSQPACASSTGVTLNNWRWVACR